MAETFCLEGIQSWEDLSEILLETPLEVLEALLEEFKIQASSSSVLLKPGRCIVGRSAFERIGLDMLAAINGGDPDSCEVLVVPDDSEKLH